MELLDYNWENDYSINYIEYWDDDDLKLKH